MAFPGGTLPEPPEEQRNIIDVMKILSFTGGNYVFYKLHPHGFTCFSGTFIRAHVYIWILEFVNLFYPKFGLFFNGVFECVIY